MTIILPRLPRQTAYDLRPVRNSETQRAGTGGSLTPLRRLGDHWAVEVDVGVLATLCGRSLLADLVRGMGERIRVPISQVGVDIGAPGTLSVTHSDGTPFSDATRYAPVMPKVAGDGQSGSVLLLDHFTPGYEVRKGQFFTVETAGGASAHIVTDAATAGELGSVAISFWPMLWLEPQDGDHIEWVNPYVEGLVIEDGGQMSGVFAAVSMDSFTIEEG